MSYGTPRNPWPAGWHPPRGRPLPHPPSSTGNGWKNFRQRSRTAAWSKTLCRCRYDGGLDILVCCVIFQSKRIDQKGEPGAVAAKEWHMERKIIRISSKRQITIRLPTASEKDRKRMVVILFGAGTKENFC